jgi:hypothetical protein
MGSAVSLNGHRPLHAGDPIFPEGNWIARTSRAMTMKAPKKAKSLSNILVAPYQYSG